MKYNIPPVAKSERSNILDEEILRISKELFDIPLFGYGIGILFNIIFLYYLYKKATLFSLIYFIILYYIIIRAIQTKLFES